MKSANPEDYEQGEFFKKEGQARVLKHTPDSWYFAMFSAAEALLRTRGSFTSEDLREIAGDSPGHPNAVGATTTAIVKKLNLRAVGRTKSRRVRSHGAALVVWGK